MALLNLNYKKQQDCLSRYEETVKVLQEQISEIKATNFDLITKSEKMMEEHLEEMQSLQRHMKKMRQSSTPRPSQYPIHTPRPKVKPEVPKLNIPKPPEPCQPGSSKDSEKCQPCQPESSKDEWEDAEEWTQKEWDEWHDWDEWKEDDNKDEKDEKPRSKSATPAPEAQIIAPHRRTLPTNVLGHEILPHHPGYIKNDDWIEFSKQPSPGRVPEWRTECKKRVAQAVKRNPELGLIWWAEADAIIDAKLSEEQAQEALRNSGEFHAMDIMIAKSFWSIVKGDWIANIKYKEEQLMKRNIILKGRQLYWYICTELTRSTFLDDMDHLDHFNNLALRNDNLQGYLNAWKKAENKMASKAEQKVRVWKLYQDIETSAQFAKTMERHMYNITHEGGHRDFDTLWKMVESHIEANRTIRNDKNPKVAENNGWGLAAGKGKGKDDKKGKGKGKQDEKGGKGKGAGKWDDSQTTNGKNPAGNCDKYFYNGACPRPEGECWKKHDETLYPNGKGTRKGKGKGKGKDKGKGKGKDEGKKGDQKGSGKARSTSSNREKITRGKSPSGKLDRGPCRDFITNKGWCPKGKLCDWWHPGVCTDWRKSGDCPDGKACKFLHFEKVKQPSATPAEAPKAKSKAKAKAKPAVVALFRPKKTWVRVGGDPVNWPEEEPWTLEPEDLREETAFKSRLINKGDANLPNGTWPDLGETEISWPQLDHEILFTDSSPNGFLARSPSFVHAANESGFWVVEPPLDQ